VLLKAVVASAFDLKETLKCKKAQNKVC
jgi:hypothetical protein